jgi:hypothetical protein
VVRETKESVLIGQVMFEVLFHDRRLFDDVTVNPGTVCKIGLDDVSTSTSPNDRTKRLRSPRSAKADTGKLERGLDQDRIRALKIIEPVPPGRPKSAADPQISRALIRASS